MERVSRLSLAFDEGRQNETPGCLDSISGGSAAKPDAMVLPTHARGHRPVAIATAHMTQLASAFAHSLPKKVKSLNPNWMEQELRKDAK